MRTCEPRGTGGREPGRIGAGGVRESGEERAGCRGSKRAGKKCKTVRC